MEVKIKYSVNDTVFAIQERIPGRYEVLGIITKTYKNAYETIVTEIEYKLDGLRINPDITLKEALVFATEKDMFEEISQRLK